jgi:hypothetical protein
MADLATTGVAINAGRSSELIMTGRKVRLVQFTLTLSSMGSATNKILASVLGFKEILWASPAVKSDNSEIVPAAPSTDGSMLLLRASATEAPADSTGTYNLMVAGTPATSNITD